MLLHMKPVPLVQGELQLAQWDELRNVGHALQSDICCVSCIAADVDVIASNSSMVSCCGPDLSVRD